MTDGAQCTPCLSGHRNAGPQAGPGAGAAPDHRRFFDPRTYRIVIFDQRGAGRSPPAGAITDNTTQHLIADMEQLRERLGIARWHLFGGSWGSTLALAYAQAHPERVTGLVLRGIFLSRKQEIDWFLYGIRTLFPEAWQRFAGFLPEEERGDLLANYYRRLTDPDPMVHMPAARNWSTYEGSCSTLLPSPETVAAFGEDRMALGLARTEAHYFVNAILLGTQVLAQPGHAEEPARDDPAFLGFAVGWYDANLRDDQAVDFRLEYRHDARLVGPVKPWAGLEATSDGGLWGGAGILLDLYFGRRLVLTGSFAPGAYANGGGKDLGHTVEFRSQIELGYRFDDRSRLSLALSHLSNAGLGDENPGVEVLSLYYHLPLGTLF